MMKEVQFAAGGVSGRNPKLSPQILVDIDPAPFCGNKPENGRLCSHRGNGNRWWRGLYACKRNTQFFYETTTQLPVPLTIVDDNIPEDNETVR
ncbi:MAG: hypothetical protein U5L04_05715 [Trueperaceae bacterium]|nr:hypothetical protein [Trueperaceae bacterium]